MKYKAAYQQGSVTTRFGGEAGVAAGSLQCVPQDLDFHLAVYCIAEAIGDLDTGKWKTLFGTHDKKIKKMDPDAVRAFDAMRERYVSVKPSTVIGWKNKNPNLFQKVIRGRVCQGRLVPAFVQLTG